MSEEPEQDRPPQQSVPTKKSAAVDEQDAAEERALLDELRGGHNAISLADRDRINKYGRLAQKLNLIPSAATFFHMFVAYTLRQLTIRHRESPVDDGVLVDEVTVYFGSTNGPRIWPNDPTRCEHLINTWPSAPTWAEDGIITDAQRAQWRTRNVGSGNEVPNPSDEVLASRLGKALREYFEAVLTDVRSGKCDCLRRLPRGEVNRMDFVYAVKGDVGARIRVAQWLGWWPLIL